MDDAGTTASSAAPTVTSPAAPATSAPPSSPAPAARPTFEQVFAAPPAAPTTPEIAVAPQGTTEPPVAPDAAAVHPSAKPPGPIPFEVHKTALDNARAKATAEAQAAFDRDYSWAKQVSPETVQRWSGIASLMATNPSAFLDQYFSEAATHPTFGPQVKSWAAKTLARRAEPAAPDLSPDVVVQDPQTGREVARTFTAERVQAIVDAIVQKQVAPLRRDLETRQAREQQQQAEAQQAEASRRLEASTDAVLADLHDLLDITEQTPQAQKDALFSELTALLDANPQLSPHKAAMQVRKTRIMPALQGQVTQQVLDDLTHRAGAQAMNPSRAGIAPAHRPKSFNDPSLKW
jgi:hypothetical protein